VLVPSPARDTHSRVPRFDVLLKLILGASLTFILMVVVDAFSVGEVVMIGESHLSTVNLYIFNLGAMTIVVWFGSLANLDKVGELVSLLVGNAAANTAGCSASELCDGDPAGGLEGWLGNAVKNVWVPVTLLFLLVGWLIYASGGIANSPYSQVPIVMMVVGQSVYDTPSVELRADAKLMNLPIFVKGVVRHYLYPIAMFALLLIGLVLLQAYHPLVTKPAPELENIFTTLLGLVVSMCVVAVTRRADQALPRGTHEGDLPVAPPEDQGMHEGDLRVASPEDQGMHEGDLPVASPEDQGVREEDRSAAPPGGQGAGCTHTQLFTSGPTRSASAGPNNPSSSPRESSEISSHPPAAPIRQ
jgi:hypothetical protein